MRERETWFMYYIFHCFENFVAPQFWACVHTRARKKKKKKKVENLIDHVSIHKLHYCIFYSLGILHDYAESTNTFQEREKRNSTAEPPIDNLVS